jgi:hypothetical protein
MTTLAFIVATNNDAMLEKNLLNSKVIRDQKYPVCLHQDVFLPDGWENQALASLNKLADSNWGVLGVAGIKLVERRRVLLGHIRDRGAEFGSPENLPAPVDTLDELLLMVRNDRKLIFDEEIPTTHLYGADICLQASSQGLGCFAISAYCHHNSIDSNFHSPEFRMAVKYMQKKWKRRLPFVTTCTLVETRTVENLRRIVSGLGLQPLARPIAARVRRLQSLRLARKRS